MIRNSCMGRLLQSYLYKPRRSAAKVCEGDLWKVDAGRLGGPPVAGLAPFCQRSEAIGRLEGADVSGRRVRKWVLVKQTEDVGRPFEQPDGEADEPTVAHGIGE